MTFQIHPRGIKSPLSATQATDHEGHSKLFGISLFEPTDYVNLKDSVLTTDSLRVAKHFGKRRSNVLRAYDQLTCSPEFSRLNFESGSFLDEHGKTDAKCE